MKQVFFAYCNQVLDCEEVLRNVERFFVGSGWNLVIPENSLGIPLQHPLKINYSIVDKSVLVIIELTSKRKEVAMLHEHAVNNGMSVLYIRRKGEGVLESLGQYVRAGFEYESPREIYEWLKSREELGNKGK